LEQKLEKQENYVVFPKQKRKIFIISEKTAKSFELEQSGVLDSELSSFYYKKYLISKKFISASIPGASNLRPRNIFVRPKLNSEFKKKIGILAIFLAPIKIYYYLFRYIIAKTEDSCI
jgi:hypothetical protein